MKELHLFLHVRRFKSTVTTLWVLSLFLRENQALCKNNQCVNIKQITIYKFGVFLTMITIGISVILVGMK